MGMTDISLRFWIAVASRDHVLGGVEGGFCQACHGKAAPLRRMRPGDGIVYYSSKMEYGKPQPCQSFTAIGRIADPEVFPFAMSRDFVPFRRRVDFLPCREAPIQPLIETLSFIKDKQRWGYSFRVGLLPIPSADFLRIAEAMGAAWYNQPTACPVVESQIEGQPIGT